jgi:hypothetical protein
MDMTETWPAFRQPFSSARLFHRAFGFLVGGGSGFSYHPLLQVRGRKSGKIYATPIDWLELDGKRCLVAPRRPTPWVRNPEAAGEVTPKNGRQVEKFGLRPLSRPEQLDVRKAYLDRFQREVQRDFPVSAASPPGAFASVANRYPAFERVDAR